MIYLDNAATSFPKPPAVYDTLAGFLQTTGANPGRSGHRMAVAAERKIDEVRTALARLLGADDPHQVIFTLNATDALNIGMKGVLEPGDHVVTSLLEHNSVSRPLKHLEDAGVITVSKVAPTAEGFLRPQEVVAAMRPETKLVALTHASNVLGTVQPIAEIGRGVRAQGKLFLVDAAQTAGIIPIDVRASAVDLLACPGHKGLYGPPGVGALWVGERAAGIGSWRQGGTGGDSSSLTQPQELPYRLEGGTPNTVGIAALAAGLAYVQGEGVDAIHARETALLEQLIDGLGAQRGVRILGSTDLQRHVGVLAFVVEGLSSVELAAILDESFEIAVRPGLHCAPFVHQHVGSFPDGAVRVSPGAFSTAADIAALLAALGEILL